MVFWSTEKWNFGGVAPLERDANFHLRDCGWLMYRQTKLNLEHFRASGGLNLHFVGGRQVTVRRVVDVGDGHEYGLSTDVRGRGAVGSSTVPLDSGLVPRVSSGA